jgi:uncharacterized protein (DUF433 family)
MDWKERIDSNPEVCGGRPRIKGTRLTVEFLLSLKAAGWSEDAILREYPQLGADDLKAVFAFIQAVIEQDRFFPFPRVA